MKENSYFHFFTKDFFNILQDALQDSVKNNMQKYVDAALEMISFSCD